jgi:solute:Na+ symporter, SSS family
MTERSLNAAQVASLLISTSCGIGFLLGTGEFAMHQGMASSLYAVATALGLAVLAFCAPLLWTAGRSIWNWFAQLYGPSVSSHVALLSLVWMTGVLAAQIRRASSLLALTTMPPASALLLTDLLLVGLSLMRLSWLSAGFALSMLACNVVLVHALVKTGGLVAWLHAPTRFIDAVRLLPPAHTGYVVVSVVAMVICGTDYQQFIIAAHTPTTARTGSLLAAMVVFTIGFLPASAVIAAVPIWHLDGVADPVQIVPIVLMHSFSLYSMSATRDLVIFIPLTTALGSGCSILRAMSDATATLGPRIIAKPLWSRSFPIVLASLVSMRGQSLVDMMVDLNMVYLAAVGPLLGLGLVRVHVSDKAAKASIAAGCGIAVTCYLIRWTGIVAMPEVTPLFVAPPLCLAVMLAPSMWTAFASSKPNQPPGSR